MIPPFDPAPGALPPGIHEATWAAVVVRYGYNPVRRRLLDGLAMALEGLRVAGCRRAYLGGSFVTTKPEPGDFDMCWDVAGVDEDRLHFIFLVMDNRRQMQGVPEPPRELTPEQQKMVEQARKDFAERFGEKAKRALEEIERAIP
jgi:hypothetical protein